MQPVPTTPGVQQESAQERFDRTYITSSEICRDLCVTRPAVLQARRRGLLPDPIVVNDMSIYIWERCTVQPYLDAWRIILTQRRANAEHNTALTAA